MAESRPETAGRPLFAAPDPVSAAAVGEDAKTAAAGDLSELRKGRGNGGFRGVFPSFRWILVEKTMNKGSVEGPGVM